MLFGSTGGEAYTHIYIYNQFHFVRLFSSSSFSITHIYNINVLFYFFFRFVFVSLDPHVYGLIIPIQSSLSSLSSSFFSKKKAIIYHDSDVCSRSESVWLTLKINKISPYMRISQCVCCVEKTKIQRSYSTFFVSLGFELLT